MPRFTITIEDICDNYVSQLGGIESCYEGQELNVVEHDALLNEDGDFLVGGNVIIPDGHGNNVTSWWHIGQETRYGLKVTKLESEKFRESVLTISEEDVIMKVDMGTCGLVGVHW